MSDPEIRCACPSIGAYDCIRRRYPAQFICDDVSDDVDEFEPCQCPCHDEYNAEEDDY